MVLRSLPAVQDMATAVDVLSPPRGKEGECTDVREDRFDSGVAPSTAIRRLLAFFGIVLGLILAMNVMITQGFRHVKTSTYGAWNRVMDGGANAEIVINGSSRALAHYDPRTIEKITGRTAFNIGRNGSQTDMQVAILKTYLEHNRKPEIVIQNLDAFTFQTTKEVYDPVEYTPYLYDHSLYDALWKINENVWKSREIPLYGYVVEDMNFSWMTGLRGFFGISPREDYFSGFNPRDREWTSDFQNFKAGNPQGTAFEIQPGGIEAVEHLIDLCRLKGIQLIFVYSPEYREMQEMTNNRSKIFAKFHDLASENQIPFWDYSDWRFAGDENYFQNSQHLNARGAAAFSVDLAEELKDYLDQKSEFAGRSSAPQRAESLPRGNR